jgi:hypothetical protein
VKYLAILLVLTVMENNVENVGAAGVFRGFGQLYNKNKTCLSSQRNRAVLRRGLAADMREVNGFFIYELGGIVLLNAFPVDDELNDAGLDALREIRKTISSFVEAPENQQELPNSVDDALDLGKLLDEAISSKPPAITKANKQKILYRLGTFRDRMSAELHRVYSYVLEEKGGRSVKTLWTKALTLLSPPVLINLSDFTAENIDEAAKCWIVDRTTAVGFHSMRAVERVLREYKTLITGEGVSFVDKRGTTQYQGFGTLIGDLAKRLEDLKKNKIAFGRLELIVGILRPLSKLYRDPLAHPELKRLDEDDAKLAFEQGLLAISTMIQDSTEGGVHFARPWENGMKF